MTRGVSSELAAAIGVLLLAAVAATCGCAASPLRRHAAAATLATVALAGYGDAVIEGTRARLAACPGPGLEGREACIDAAERDALAAGAAHDAVRPLLAGYRDALQAGALSGDDPDVEAALSVLALRLLREWESVVEAGRALGVEVPALGLGGAL